MAYGELQAAGIEFPAGIVSELELAGAEIERCQAPGPGERPVRAVRLRSATNGLTEGPPARVHRAIVPAGPEAGWSPVRVYRASRQRGWQDQWPASTESDAMAAYAPPIAPSAGHRRPRRRVRARALVPLALLLALAVILVVVLTGTSGGHNHSTPAAPPRRHGPAHAHAGAGKGLSARSSSQTPASSAQHASTSAVAAKVPVLPATPVSPTLASTLETHGHSLLAAGQYSAAVPVLKRAVAASGERVSACADPTTQNCLTYAFALFDLGRALQFSGHSGQAVAVLEQRLQIDNQRTEVAAQLQSARQG